MKKNKELTANEFYEREQKQINKIKHKRLMVLQEQINLLEIENCTNIVIEECMNEYYDYKISYDVVIDETIGYKQNEYALWHNDESLEIVVQKMAKHINYILQIYHENKDFCIINKYIQENIQYEREIQRNIYDKKSKITIKLGDKLLLPNTTDNSYGGGDYEIKNTPERLKSFNHSINNAIDQFIEAISDLKIIQKNIPKLEEGEKK